jgi:hypothetical protein
MKRFTELLLVSSLLFGGTGMVAAQEKSTTATPPPNVLTIFREFVKPGKQGMTHEKTESAFVQALKAAKWPTHYLAVDSFSGKPRSLFLTPYDSFEAWEKDVQAAQKNATLNAALDRAGVADGELLSDADGGAFAYREEYSLRAPSDIPHMRYFEISVFHVRPGHEKDWDALAKMYVAGYEKVPDVHWATYETVYGQQSGTYLVFTPMKSATEIDRESGQDKQFKAAMGEEGMKKLSELAAAAIESSQTNLFTFNPRMSYVSDDWVKADPEFWAPKPAHAPAAASKKPAEKPSTQQ